jgi:hypothetical protein
MFKHQKAMIIHRFFFLLLPLFLLLSGCEKTNYSDWTILIYMAADNGLNNAAISDIEEMQLAGFSENIKVIVQIDYSENQPEYQGTRRFQITPGKADYLNSLGEINSGDGSQISRFANWGFDEYPSKRNALIIWSHGNSWYSHPTTPAKFCPDYESNDFINIPEGELKTAFQNINSHIDITILDACNMMSLGVAAEIFEYTDYIIGSEEEVNTDGFPYGDNVGTGILDIWEDYSSTEMLASEIVDSYMSSYFPGGSQYPGYEGLLACSALKASEYSSLLDDISGFVDLSPSIEEITVARENCVEFNDLDSDVDIKDFFYKLSVITEDQELKNKCENIIDAIDGCFVNQRFVDYLSGNVGTATIWFPDNDNSAYEDLNAFFANLQLNNLTNWKNFLDQTFE